MRRLSLWFLNLQYFRGSSPNRLVLYTSLKFLKKFQSKKEKKKLFSSLFTALVHPENTLVNLLTFNALDAFKCIELQNGEFLLAFYALGVYVDSQGRKSRDREIMYTAYPTAVSELKKTYPKSLCVFLFKSNI